MANDGISLFILACSKSSMNYFKSSKWEVFRAQQHPLMHLQFTGTLLTRSFSYHFWISWIAFHSEVSIFNALLHKLSFQKRFERFLNRNLTVLCPLCVSEWHIVQMWIASNFLYADFLQNKRFTVFVFLLFVVWFWNLCCVWCHLLNGNVVDGMVTKPWAAQVCLLKSLHVWMMKVMSWEFCDKSYSWAVTEPWVSLGWHPKSPT